MVNQNNILLDKSILFRAVPLVFTVLFFVQIAPIPQLQFIHNAEPIVLWSSTLLFIVGLVFIVEFFRNLPDTGNHNGAKTGAYMFLVMGLIAFGFGFADIAGIYDPFSNNNDTLNLLLSLLLGLSSIILYISLHPSIFHRKRTLAQLVRSS